MYDFMGHAQGLPTGAESSAIEAAAQKNDSARRAGTAAPRAVLLYSLFASAAELSAAGGTRPPGAERQFGIAQLGQPGELENIGIAQHLCDAFLRFLLARSLYHGLLIGGKPRAFIEQAFDLSLKLAYRPMAAQAFVLIEGPLPWIVQADEFLKLAPGKTQDFLGGKRGWQFGGHCPAN